MGQLQARKMHEAINYPESDRRDTERKVFKLSLGSGE